MEDICGDAHDAEERLVSILRRVRSKKDSETIVCMHVHKLTWKAMQDARMSATSTRSFDLNWV